MNPPELEIRPYTPDAYEDVCDLYDRAWPGDVERRKTAFRWLHEENPFAQADTGYLLGYKGGVLAGYWGRMPMRFYHRGRPMDFVFTQEALVDPQFRRQGIARELMDAATADPALYLSLWHNEKIVSLLESSGWSSVGRYRTRKRILRADGLVTWKLGSARLGKLIGAPLNLFLEASRRGPRPSGSMEVLTVESFDAEADRFFHATAGELPFIADRTSKVLNWRFGDIPHRTFHRLAAFGGSNGQFRGYMIGEVTELSDEGLVRGDIVDFLCAPGDTDTLHALLGEMERFFRKEGVDFAVLLQTHPDSSELLTKRGFRAARRPGVGSQLLYLDRRSDPTPPPGNSYEEWYITHGDSDGHLW